MSLAGPFSGTSGEEPPRPRLLCGWGRYPVVKGRQREGESLERITEGSALCRGMGRSYGDASLPADGDSILAKTTRGDRLLAFDPASGGFRAEAGLTLREINRIFLPRSFFVPVSPGTQDVTLGGMVAADVHGKNHHVAGSIGEHVEALRMRVADGRILEVTEESEPDLFRATLGGMGLTGHILEVQLRLERIPSPWIRFESERAADLGSVIEALRRSSRSWPFTVAWADCLARGRGMGRGIVLRGRWADPSEAPPDPPRPRRGLELPFTLPDRTCAPAAVRLFNALRYRRHGRRMRRGIQHPEAFFYPLDALGSWNRVYGRRGFTQYQCVLPAARVPEACQGLLERFRERRGVAFLCVIKDSGAQGRGMLSFPMPGISIALDIPVRGERTRALVDALNEQVIELGGRVYLAKDAFTRPEHYVAMEPRLPAWEAVRKAWDPGRRIRSAQSARLLEGRA